MEQPKADVASHPKADQLVADDIIPCFSDMKIRVGDLPRSILLDEDFSPYGLLLHAMGKRLPRAAAVAVNTVQGVDPAIDAELASAFKKYLPVGPFNLLHLPNKEEEEEEEECIAWLDRQDSSSVTYVSFGTTASLPPSEIAELAHGLEASGGPFLWSLKRNLSESLPVGFLERIEIKTEKGMVLEWVPQTRVLAHGSVGVTVNHCGWNSVLEAVSYGVPVICRPLFGDQMMALRTVSDVWKVGIGFDGGKITREGLVTCLKKFSNGEEDEEGREIRKNTRELKAKIWREVGPGGSTANNLDCLLQIIVKGT